MPILTGADYQRSIRLRDHASKLPVDLTGFDLQLVVKAQRGDAAALITLTIGNGLAVADPASGDVVLDLDAAKTSAIGAGERVFALFRTDGGRRLVLATGKMKLIDF